jgi:hypothetical protein
MPKKAHKNLIKQAKKKGMKKGSKRYKKYVYGTLNKIKKKN